MSDLMKIFNMVHNIFIQVIAQIKGVLLGKQRSHMGQSVIVKQHDVRHQMVPQSMLAKQLVVRLTPVSSIYLIYVPYSFVAICYLTNVLYDECDVPSQLLCLSFCSYNQYGKFLLLLHLSSISS